MPGYTNALSYSCRQAKEKQQKNPPQNETKKIIVIKEIKVINEDGSLSLVYVHLYLIPTLPVLRRGRGALLQTAGCCPSRDRAGQGLRVLGEAGRASERRDSQLRWQKVLNQRCVAFSFCFFVSA